MYIFNIYWDEKNFFSIYTPLIIINKRNYKKIILCNNNSNIF